MGGRRATGGLLLVVLTAGCSANAQVSEPDPIAAETTVTTTVPPRAETQALTVQLVVDGHSVRLSDGTTVQVPGLAAPGACWAQAASDFTTRMLLNQPVKVDRTTGAISLQDGTDFALLALGNGAARTGPAANAAMKEAEATAQQGTLGLWGAPCSGKDVTATPPPPPPPPPAPKPTTTKPRPTTTTPTRRPPVYYASCDEAHRAGAAPIFWDEPGYRVELDQNRNGIACE